MHTIKSLNDVKSHIVVAQALQVGRNLFRQIFEEYLGMEGLLILRRNKFRPADNRIATKMWQILPLSPIYQVESSFRTVAIKQQMISF